MAIKVPTNAMYVGRVGTKPYITYLEFPPRTMVFLNDLHTLQYGKFKVEMLNIMAITL